MPPRVRLRSQQLCLRPNNHLQISQQCRYASVATATTPAAPVDQTIHASHPVQRYPPTQPPSYKPPQFRKSQLHRQYASLLRSTPLILIFQHNNLKSNEWMAIRRELMQALRKVDEAEKTGYADFIRMHIIQTGIFAASLRVVEFFNGSEQPRAPTLHPTDPRTNSSKAVSEDPQYNHGLSEAAYEAVQKKRLKHGLEPLMSGPLMLLTLPTVSPAHLKAALQILSPSPDFPAPKRRTNPSFHEPAVQNGLQKLLLLGARAEGRIFDLEGARWIGGIQGGLDGLRAQVVAILQAFGANLTNTLEVASKSLYFTMEGRKNMLEEEENAKEESR